MKSQKTNKQVAVTKEDSLRENARNEVCGLCALGNAVIEGRNEQEQIALVKKLTAQVEAMGIAKINASEFAGMNENTLGELSCELTNKLNDAIAKGRTPAEEIGLIKQLMYQVEMMDSPEPKTNEKASEMNMKEQISLIESLTAQVDEMSETIKKSSAGQREDERLVLETKRLFKQLRRRIYDCLVFLCSIDEIAEVFCEDSKREFRELKENWSQWYKDDLGDCEPTTTKIAPALAADRVKKAG